MSVLKDFECDRCKETFEKLVTSEQKYTACPRCGGVGGLVFRKAPSVHGCQNFNAHYDWQLGQHFNSAEEKTNFLEKTGRAQVAGMPSPRKSTNTSIICTKEQSAKLEKVTPDSNTITKE